MPVTGLAAGIAERSAAKFFRDGVPIDADFNLNFMLFAGDQSPAVRAVAVGVAVVEFLGDAPFGLDLHSSAFGWHGCLSCLVARLAAAASPDRVTPRPGRVFVHSSPCSPSVSSSHP